jgi:DNA-binding protein H-NS
MEELQTYTLEELEELSAKVGALIERLESLRDAGQDLAAAGPAGGEPVAEASVAKSEADAAPTGQASPEDAPPAVQAPPAPAEPPAPPPKYMHPSNRKLTWTGDGKTPEWIGAWLSTGGTMYALEIAAEKLAPRPMPKFEVLPDLPEYANNNRSTEQEQGPEQGQEQGQGQGQGRQERRGRKHRRNKGPRHTPPPA